MGLVAMTAPSCMMNKTSRAARVDAMQLRSDSWGQSVEEDGDDLPCQRESLHGFALRRDLGIAGVTKLPGEHCKISGFEQHRLQRRVNRLTGSGEFVQVMRFPKDALMRRQVALHRLLGGLLAMKQGIFDQGWCGGQVDVGATQIVRGVLKPRPCFRGGFRLYRAECLPARRQPGGRSPRCASGRIPHASTPEYPLRLRHRSRYGTPLARVDTATTPTLLAPSTGRNRCQGRLLREPESRIARLAQAGRHRLSGARSLRGSDPQVFGGFGRDVGVAWLEPSTGLQLRNFMVVSSY